MVNIYKHSTNGKLITKIITTVTEGKLEVYLSSYSIKSKFKRTSNPSNIFQ